MLEQRESKDDISELNNKQCCAVSVPDALPAHIPPALLSTSRLMKMLCISGGAGKTELLVQKGESKNLTCSQRTVSDRFHGKPEEGKQEL